MKAFISTLISIFRVIFYSKKTPNLFDKEEKSNTALILGNGPSLSNQVETFMQHRHIFDIFCMNWFAESTLYQKVKPNYYVFADPAFFLDDVSVEIKERSRALFSQIVEITDWPIKIFIPARFAEKNYKENLENEYLEIVYYNNVGLKGYSSLMHELYDLGLGSPPAQNVLIASLILAIHQNFRTICMIGADHSWHETIKVDFENKVYLNDVHFYNPRAGSTPWTNHCTSNNLNFRMDTLFFSLGLMFEGYFMVNSYARYKEISIYNCSSKTYIDAFERASLDNLIGDK